MRWIIENKRDWRTFFSLWISLPIRCDGEERRRDSNRTALQQLRFFFFLINSDDQYSFPTSPSQNYRMSIFCWVIVPGWSQVVVFVWPLVLWRHKCLGTNKLNRCSNWVVSGRWLKTTTVGWRQRQRRRRRRRKEERGESGNRVDQNTKEDQEGCKKIPSRERKNQKKLDKVQPPNDRSKVVPV